MAKTPPQSIALIGYRGTGKSAVTQHAALRLSWDWIDADVEVELRRTAPKYG